MAPGRRNASAPDRRAAGRSVAASYERGTLNVQLVFVHGAASTHAIFDAQLAAFPGAAALRLPGHECPGEPASIAAFADAVLADLHDRNDVILCGHSMGGAIALEAALRNDPRVRAVVMLASGARLRVGPAIFGPLESDFETAAFEIPRFFYAEPTPERLAVSTAMMRAVGQAQCIRDFHACDAFDRIANLGDVRVPLLALTGDRDVMTPLKFAAALADRVPAGQARIVEGAGHLVMMERPDETNAALQAFVDQLTSSNS